jgi:hypothetical protein
MTTVMLPFSLNKFGKLNIPRGVMPDDMWVAREWHMERTREKRKPQTTKVYWPAIPSDQEVERALHSIPVHRSASTYMVINSTAPTTAAPVKQPTAAVIQTMVQLAPQTSPNTAIRVFEWGISFDASAAATPGQVEMFGCTGAATMTTAYAAGDIMPFGNTNSPANTASTTGVPLALGTALSAFAHTTVTEGTVANYRAGDLQLLPPTAPYVKQMPLGREFEIIGNQGAAQNFLRIRVTFGSSINCYTYLLFEC